MSLISGVALALAWLFPGDLICAALGWVVALGLSQLAYRGASYVCLLVVGISSHTLAFHWLWGTIADFGGFPWIATLFLFLAFVLGSSLQFPLFLFLFRFLPRWLQYSGAGPALAWTASELLFPRIFPWQIAHTQLGMTPLIQFADVAGSYGVSFLLLWLAAAVLLPAEKTSFAKTALPAIALFSALTYGDGTIEHYESLLAESKEKEISLVVPQANIPIKQKRNIKYFGRNTAEYIRLSAPYADDGALIIWPESVLLEWIPENIGKVKRDSRLQAVWNNSAMLIGTLSVGSGGEMYNSALAIQPNGSVPTPYHKRILMPFGEFTPFSSIFPFIKEINSTAGDFSRGQGARVFDFQVSGQRAKVSPLICYEDVVSGLARESVLEGAELLVNMTNDAWFGNTAAPHQHHLIASFRAVENKRFLVRSTNTGLTAVVDPLGRTISKLPVYDTAVLKTNIVLLEGRTFFTKVGDRPWWILILLVLIAGLRNLKIRPKKKTGS